MIINEKVGAGGAEGGDGGTEVVMIIDFRVGCGYQWLSHN